jgi:hypothetical protein
MFAKAGVASKPFQGIRIEVDTVVSFDEVLSRLRGLMGDASAQKVVPLAKEAVTQAEYVQKVEECGCRDLASTGAPCAGFSAIR